MKFELVITVWDDGVFRLRDRLEFDANDIDSLEKQFEILMKIIGERLFHPKHPFMEDDDIPF